MTSQPRSFERLEAENERLEARVRELEAALREIERKADDALLACEGTAEMVRAALGGGS